LYRSTRPSLNQNLRGILNWIIKQIVVTLFWGYSKLNIATKH
jgi:hypothetical protein